MPTTNTISLRSMGLLVSVLIGIMVLAVSAFGFLSRANRLRGMWPPEADTFYLPPSSALRIASLRHTELAADLLHARANVYFGTQLHARVPTKWLAKYLHSAIDMDPQFKRLYLAGAAMLIYNGQRISPDMVLSAITVLERGHKAFPFDWEFPFQIGFHLLFELPQDAGEDDPRVPGWRQKGVEMLRQAALYEDVPYYIPSLVARMLTKRGANDLAIHHLEQAYAISSNPETRTQIKNKLFLLRGQQFSEELEEHLRTFDRMIAEGFPEAPEAFSIIAGPRITTLSILTPPSLSAKPALVP
jgi:hypothetical protein